MKKIDRTKSTNSVVMFDGYSNVQLVGDLMKINRNKFTVIHGVEYTVYLLFNDVSKLLTVNQIIRSHKAIYNIFGSGVYHKTYFIFKPKLYKFTDSNISLFIGKNTITEVCFMGMRRYLLIRKVIFATISLAEFICTNLNDKLSQVVAYTTDDKSWKRGYVFLKLCSHSLGFFV